MTHDARRLYRHLGLDIEPNWHAALLLLEGSPGIGVAEIARRLGITHPSASALVGQLLERGYLATDDDPSDGRRRVLRLTDRATRALPELKAVWSASAEAIESAILASGQDVLAAVSALEAAFAARAYDDRTLDVLERGDTPPGDTPPGVPGAVPRPGPAASEPAR